MEMWFCSDWHLGHENIIRYSSRPFTNAKEMDEYILTTHNERVKAQDHVYNLGDVTMSRGSRGSPQAQRFIKLARSFHGHFRLLLGNHDHFPIQVYLDAGFEKIYATHRNEHNMLLSHFPIHPKHMGSVVGNIHGHIHQNPSPEPMLWIEKSGVVHVIPYINICVEKTGYGPVHIDEIKRMIKEKIDESNKDSAETA